MVTRHSRLQTLKTFPACICMWLVELQLGSHFRLNVQHQYGVTNVFNRFNDSEALATAKPEGGFRNVGMWF